MWCPCSHRTTSKDDQGVTLSLAPKDTCNPEKSGSKLRGEDTITWRVRAATELDRQRQKDSEQFRQQLSLTVNTERFRADPERTTAHRLHTNNAHTPTNPPEDKKPKGQKSSDPG